MQLTMTISPDSASFIEKKRVEIGCGEKVNFCGEKEKNMWVDTSQPARSGQDRDRGELPLLLALPRSLPCSLRLLPSLPQAPSLPLRF